jgi:hypothetical protein
MEFRGFFNRSGIDSSQNFKLNGNVIKLTSTVVWDVASFSLVELYCCFEINGVGSILEIISKLLFA